MSKGAVKDRLKHALALVFTVAGLVGTSNLWAADASKEKCTCNLEGSAQQQDGAWVQNATACWLTKDDKHHWCDITVESLEGGASQSIIINKLMSDEDNGSDFGRALQTQFEGFISSANVAKSSFEFDRKAAEDVVPALIKEKQAEISKCISAFRDASFGKGGYTLEGEDNFRCGVGSVSGWLRIEFRVGSVWLVYLLAPHA